LEITVFTLQWIHTHVYTRFVCILKSGYRTFRPPVPRWLE